MARGLFLFSFILVLLRPLSILAQEDHYSQLEIGYPIGVSIKYGYILGFEKKFKSIEKFTFALNYGLHKRQNILVGTSGQTSYIIPKFKYITLLARMHPLQNKLGTWKGPYVSFGYQHFWLLYNDSIFEQGSGIRIELGGQITLGKLFVLSGNIDFYSYLSNAAHLSNSINFGGLNLNIKVGVRF